MKTNKNALNQQRKVLSKRLTNWMQFSDQMPPPSGWIRAVRSALGITTRQLAQLMKTNHAGIAALEKREASGKVSIEMIERAAQAMGCRFVYAIIPQEPNRSLDEILEQRATQVAQKVLGRLEHSMRLEKQGSSNAEIADEIKRLAIELKDSLDSRLWDSDTKKRSA